MQGKQMFYQILNFSNHFTVFFNKTFALNTYEHSDALDVGCNNLFSYNAKDTPTIFPEPVRKLEIQQSRLQFNNYNYDLLLVYLTGLHLKNILCFPNWF